MNQKLKKVIISSLILAIPLSYFLYETKLYDDANTAYNEHVMGHGYDSIEEVLLKVNKADNNLFWKKRLIDIKIKLLVKKKAYQDALELLKTTEAYLYTGWIYEKLNQTDSALIYYEKEIELQLSQLEDYEDDLVLKYQIERQIALLYTFLNEKDKAKAFIKAIPKDFEFHQKQHLLQYEFYIENYQSGGYPDFLEGKTLLFGRDHISKHIDMDSLIKANRFYFNERSKSGMRETYKIKKIFKQKAIDSGLNLMDDKK